MNLDQLKIVFYKILHYLLEAECLIYAWTIPRFVQIMSFHFCFISVDLLLIGILKTNWCETLPKIQYLPQKKIDLEICHVKTATILILPQCVESYCCMLRVYPQQSDFIHLNKSNREKKGMSRQCQTCIPVLIGWLNRELNWNIYNFVDDIC